MAGAPDSVQRRDVCIVGGGFAGLTLARHLRRRLPDLDIAVVERRRFPVPEAAHKVGESTVEIASHYLANGLGLKENLEREQLRKFGLRLFCRGETPVDRDLAAYDEIGPSAALPIPTYQLDRGRFENHLARTWKEIGELRDGTAVRSVEIERGAHRVVLRDPGEGKEKTLRCRYLIDASGRRGFLRRSRGTARSVRHPQHAVWLRLRGLVDIESLSTDSEWLSRCSGELPRRASTVHFTGPGYWLWLIPLASGMTSVGLVFDPARLALEEVRSRTDLIRWLERQHPLVAAELAEREVLDHSFLSNYAVGNSDVFSEDGWAATGDASLFTDPLYSPGGDFIALANTYAVELIARGFPPDRVENYQRNYQALFANTMLLYRGQYPGFGDRTLIVAKTMWDYAFYWSIPAKLFFSGRITDLEFMRRNENLLQRAAALHSGVQRLFRDHAAKAGRVGGEGRFFDHHAVPLFHELQADLREGDPDAAETRLTRNVDRLQAAATGIRGILAEGAGSLGRWSLGQVPGFG